MGTSREIATLKHPSEHSRGRAGTALVSVVILSGSLAVMAYCLTAFSTATTAERRESWQNWSAIQIAEAGLSEAVAAMGRGESGALGDEGAPVAFGPTAYWVESTALGGDRVRLVSTGQADGCQARIEMLVEASPGLDGNWGVFGLEWLHLDSNAVVDSYASSEGSYASQVNDRYRGRRLAGDDILVGSNGDVSMDQNSIVWGDVQAGPDATATVRGNAHVSGTTGTMRREQHFPEIEVPELASQGDRTVPVGLVAVLPSGQHRFEDLEVQAGGALFVNGPATIVVDSLRLRSNTELWVQPLGGPVEIIVRRELILDSNATARSLGHLPEDLTILFTGDSREDEGIEVALDSNTQVWGSMYLPHADVRISSNFTLYGSIVARSVELSSNSQVHFDTDLATFGDEEAAAFDRRSWRLLSVGPAPAAH